jgi:hypothetical protein
MKYLKPSKINLVFLFVLSFLILVQTIQPSYSGFGTHKTCGRSSFGQNCKCEVTCKSLIKDCATKSCACASEKEKKPTKDHITDEFIKHRKWIIKVLWEAHLLPAMMLMTEQISAVAMQQMFAVGSLFDAKHQLETQRLLQSEQAQSHKDYHPSEGMCTFGTNTRSLASSDRNVDLTQVALSKRMQDRDLLTGDGISGNGPRDDLRSRTAHFKKTYCNKKDLGNGMDLFCDTEDATRINNDINFTKTVEKKDTLNIDFSLNNVTEDETDVITLAANLYGNDLFPYIQQDKIATRNGNLIRNGAYTYMKVRSHHARRSVAQAALASQIALKSRGTSESRPYMEAIIEEMGFAETDLEKILDERPSYFEQMKLLTKTLYQNPNFYVELYDKPTNIDRKIVSMQALEIMQRRDMYRSNLRREAIEAVWLEGAIEDLEAIVDNRISATYTENDPMELEGLE